MIMIYSDNSDHILLIFEYRANEGMLFVQFAPYLSDSFKHFKLFYEELILINNLKLCNQIL
jgi:hypothetical protein